MAVERKQGVLITGGSGMIGRYLASILLSEGYSVSILSRGQDHFGTATSVHDGNLKRVLLIRKHLTE